MPNLHCRDETASTIVRAAVRLCLLGTLAFSANAAPPAQDTLWMAVGDQTLDSLRGGFRMGDGLTVSFGISRAVYINGALITETTLNIGRMADITPAQATQLSQKLATLNLVQNGPGNTFASGPSSTTTSSPEAAGATGDHHRGQLHRHADTELPEQSADPLPDHHQCQQQRAGHGAVHEPEQYADRGDPAEHWSALTVNRKTITIKRLMDKRIQL